VDYNKLTIKHGDYIMVKVTRRQKVINFIQSIPMNTEITSTKVARDMGESINHVSSIIGELRDAGKLYKIREEAGEGGKRLRFVYLKNNPVKSSFASMLLSSLTDHELIEEVKRRKSA
jgi:DNA-binding transcriptional ArsR family regulator